MIGTCERCGKEFVRQPPCDTAVCTCESAHEVPLHPAVILPVRMRRKLQKIGDLTNASMEQVLDAALRVGLEEIRGKNVKEVLGLG